MTAQEERTPGGGPSRTVLLTTTLTLIAVIIAGIALARDYFGWQRQEPTEAGSGSTQEPGRTGAGPGSPGAQPTTPVAAAGSPRRVNLDTLPVIAGAANMVELPHALAGTRGYERPIVITCPENAGIDRHREVRYQLNRAFVDLQATIRPYFEAPEDRDSKVFVTAQIASVQRDATIDRPIRGRQNDARMDAHRELSAKIEQADELTIRVECQAPTGFVILTGASLAVR